MQKRQVAPLRRWSYRKLALSWVRVCGEADGASCCQKHLIDFNVKSNVMLCIKTRPKVRDNETRSFRRRINTILARSSSSRCLELLWGCECECRWNLALCLVFTFAGFIFFSISSSPLIHGADEHLLPAVLWSAHKCYHAWSKAKRFTVQVFLETLQKDCKKEGNQERKRKKECTKTSVIVLSMNRTFSCIFETGVLCVSDSLSSWFACFNSPFVLRACEFSAHSCAQVPRACWNESLSAAA